MKSNWWQKSFQPRAKTIRRYHAPRRRHRPLLLEVLEERTLPATITVTTLSDVVALDGKVSLREAIESIDGAGPINADVVATGPAYGNNDKIVFDMSLFSGGPQSITLDPALGTLLISKSMAITGPMPTADLLTINGANGSAVFEVGAGGSLQVSDLTISHAPMASGSGIVIDSGFTTVLGVSGVVFSNNNSTAGNGGAIVQSGTDADTIDIETSTFVNNSAVNGGAVSVDSSSVTITDSTFVGNQATTAGGAIFSGIGAAFNISDVTITGNSAATGGGLATVSTTLPNIEDTLIAGNSATTSGPDVSGTIESFGGNLVGNTSGSGGWITSEPPPSGDLLNTDPLLDPNGLQNNGGPTPTIALQAGSPAIGAGNIPVFDTSHADQRGVARPVVGDIGAFEDELVQVTSANSSIPITSTDTFTVARSSNIGALTITLQVDPSSDVPPGFNFTGSGVSFDSATGIITVSLADGVSSATITFTPAANPLGVAEAAHTLQLDVEPGTGYVPDTVKATASVMVNANGLLVNNTLDSGDGSLRQAVDNADIGPGGGTITFSLPNSSTITLTSGVLPITQAMSIEGPSTGVTVSWDGATASSVFEVSTGGAVRISDLTITGGDGAEGAGLLVDAGLTTLQLTLSGDTFSSNNSTGDGGAVSIESGTATIINSTFTTNTANGKGGAINNVAGNVTLIFSTIAGNTAATGGGIATAPTGTTAAQDSILADSTAGSLTDDGNNLIGGTPGLASLADNGGPTPTMALLDGSPAIAAGATVSGITTDQRGSPRSGPTPDIGAFEDETVSLSSSYSPSGGPPLPINGTGTFTATRSDSIGNLTVYLTVDPSSSVPNYILDGTPNATSTAVFFPDGQLVSAPSSFTPTNPNGQANSGTFELDVEDGTGYVASASPNNSASLMVVATPAISTTASTTTATVGIAISDTATISSGFNPTGTVTFTLYSNPDGTGLLYTDPTNEPLVGGVATSASYTPTATGTVYWVATYNGDANNTPISSGTADEPVTITPANPSLTSTADNDFTLPATNSSTVTIHDSAALAGGYYETGTITFTLTLNGNAVAGATQSDTVNGDGTYNASFTLPTSGTVAATYVWHAVYSGDVNNNTASDNGANETTVVSAASPSVTTMASGPITLSSTPPPNLTDSAMLSGGYDPTGTITFTLTYNSVAVYTDHVTVSGNGTYTTATGDNAGGYTPPTSSQVTGTYTWSVSYGGDSNNNTANDQGGAAEQTVVSPAQPTIVSTASPAVTLDDTGAPTLSDSAILAGGYNETGSIVFTLTGPGGFSYTQSDLVTGTGNGTYTASTTLPTSGMVAGTYTWSVTYAGDANNSSAVDQGGSAEQTVVSPANPSIVSTASPAITLGTTAPTLSDTAVLANGYYETGSLVFTLTGPGGFTYTQNDTLSGNGTYTASTTLPTSGMVAGTYTWSVSYAGDANNNAATDQGGSAEQTVVSAANPTITTAASPAITLGTTAPILSDSAVLSGGYYETGNLVFTLTGPGGFTYTQNDTLSGNGTYTASTTLPTSGMVAGTYTWSVSYAGDANNSSAVDQGGSAEQTVVNRADPTISTIASAPPAIVTRPISDTATLSGAYFPTGTVTFNLYNNDTASGTPQFTNTVNLVGTLTPGTYTATVTYTPPPDTVLGTYYWVASFNGDPNNNAISSGTAAEPVDIVDAVSVATNASSPLGGFTVSRLGTGPLTATLDVSSSIPPGYDLTGPGVSFDPTTGVVTVTFTNNLSTTITYIPSGEAEAANTLTLTVEPGSDYVPDPLNPTTATLNIAANGLIVTNTNDSGDGSLRQAILNADVPVGVAQTITFAIPGSGTQTITLASALPAITAPVFINGYSQAGSSPNTLVQGDNAVLGVIIDGDGLTGDGLDIEPAHTQIEGLGIENFNGDGIRVSANDVTISGNFIGSVASATAAANTGNGIELDQNSSVLIGGPTVAARNLISGNNANGVYIVDFGSEVSGNTVQDNYIGTDATGTVAIGNGTAGGDGIFIQGSSNNTIGGGDPLDGNLISGNLGNGIHIQTYFSPEGWVLDASSNVVEGNFIGTDVTGADPLGNRVNGVLIDSAPGGVNAGSNQIGGSSTPPGFVSLGNQGLGVGSGFGNLISANGGDGILLNGDEVQDNTISGNYIGTDCTGTLGAATLGNKENGVEINGSNGNLIGGTSAYSGGKLSGNGNVIGNNGGNGVLIQGVNATDNLVAGNLIGVGSDGLTALANTFNGVSIQGGASGNTVGGQGSILNSGFGNVISANGINGVLISASNGNFVSANFIGTAADGKTARGNTQNGVRIDQGSQNTLIGGAGFPTSATGAGNVISGNTDSGVLLSDSTTTNNSVFGNFIGTDVTGTKAVANATGITVDAAGDNTIGGLPVAGNPPFANVISGNSGDGIHLLDAAFQNLVANNFLGVTSGLAALHNQIGVEIDSGSINNTIGIRDSDGQGAANFISENTGDGVFIHDSGTEHNAVAGNFIGTDAASDPLGNGAAGVSISGSASDNTIGVNPSNPTLNGNERNVISDNATGVVIGGIGDTGTTGNVVAGNLIGTTVNGSDKLGNIGDGVDIISAFGNTIGGDTSVANGGLLRNVISGNGGDGVLIAGSTGSAANDNVVAGNFIGTDINGAVALGNTKNGVEIDGTAGTASANSIGGGSKYSGGLRVGLGNVIASNTDDGVLIQGAGATGNSLQGNFIGTDVSGLVGLGNGTAKTSGADHGVSITTGATGNLVGGSGQPGSTGLNPFTGNLISANKGDGVFIAASSNTVSGNIIGLDVTGNATLGNTNYGIEVSGATGTFIGGASFTTGGPIDPAGNVVSGNQAGGILIDNGSTDTAVQANFVGTNLAGNTGLGNGTTGNDVTILDSDSNTIGGVNVASTLNAGNLISGQSTADGVDINDGNNNQVSNNFIGTNIDGTGAIANLNGVVLENGSSNDLIGGTGFPTTGAGNLISGNTDNGILIIGDGTGNGTGNISVFGNFIGTDVNGTNSVPNGTGITVNASEHNTIGGIPVAGNPPFANVISGNTGDGIHFINGAAANLVANNFIGVTSGLAALANQIGVEIDTGSFSNTIGIRDSDGQGAANVISENTGDGVYIHDPSTEHNAVAGNYIGTDANSDPLGNGGAGVEIANGASFNLIGIGNLNNLAAGSSNTAERNIISDNRVGVSINGVNTVGGTTSTADNYVFGNYIGTDTTGSKPLGNTQAGVEIFGGATANIVGVNPSSLIPLNANEQNVISANGTGVIIGAVGDMGTTQNIVTGNLIGTHANGTSPLGNQNDGVDITDASGNTIGGDTSVPNGSLLSNIISANSVNGIDISSSTGFEADSNSIWGNFIGTDITGTSASFGNGGNGIEIDASAGGTVSGNFIGGGSTYNGTLDSGSLVGKGNLISNSTGNGVLIQGTGATDNSLQGNFIGTDVSGSNALGNSVGVSITTGATGNVIGGSGQPGATGANPFTGNLISGNSGDGVSIATANNNTVAANIIGLEVDGGAPLGNTNYGIGVFGSTGTFIGGGSFTTGGPIYPAGNVVSGNQAGGILIGIGSTATTVQANFIGTNLAGSIGLGNGTTGNGITIQSADSNTIGGMNASLSLNAGNLISGNAGDGVDINDGNDNLLSNNFIGTDITGKLAVANTLSGVLIENGGTGNTIGGTGFPSSATGAGNLISGNGASGVSIVGATTTGNQLFGNFIGIDVTGVNPLANKTGITVDGAGSTKIGKPGTGNGNVISGNTDDGIDITDGAVSSLVQNNIIGLGSDDSTLLGNALGIRIDGTANHNTIGEGANLVAGAANVIADNQGDGVLIADSGTSQNVVAGNFIGTNLASSSGLGNTGDGVAITDAGSNTIGGDTSVTNGSLLRNIISANGGNGIDISSTTGPGANDNLVAGNFIGTTSSGTAALGNTKNGIEIDGSAGTVSANTIGGSSKYSSGLLVGLGNVIGSNTENGVLIQGSGATGNSLQGNFIGVGSDGSTQLANAGGVSITGSASGNLVGGSGQPGAASFTGNLISGNTGDGVSIATANNNTVAANIIGLEADGSTTLGNTTFGIDVSASTGTLIGGGTFTANGPIAAVGNVISENQSGGIQIDTGSSTTTVQGNFIGTDLTGKFGRGNTGNGITVDGSGSNSIGGAIFIKTVEHSGGNLISANTADGVLFENSANGNLVQGNFIGTDVTGNASLANNLGVEVTDSTNNTIGGVALNATALDDNGNLISGNTTAGIELDGSSSGNLLQGNFIGTNLAGSGAVANQTGVLVTGTATGNTIGGVIVSGPQRGGNLISGNTQDGIFIDGPGANSNFVQSNFIGTNLAGTGSLGNSGDGIAILDASDTLIGGDASTAPLVRNVISANSGDGISISYSTGTGATGNSIQGNYIGTAVTGAGSLGNGLNGVEFDGSSGTVSSNLIGGSSSRSDGQLTGPGNVISNNGGDGVYIHGSGATSNQIQGNYVGTDATGTAVLPNGTTPPAKTPVAGIRISDASGNSIGGSSSYVGGALSGVGNLISGNDTDGILLDSGASSITIQGNFIGTDVTGTQLTGGGNGNDGVDIDSGASGNLIGGAVFPSATSLTGFTGNVLSGNTAAGLEINNASNNQAAGNFIGTDITGSTALANQDGVRIEAGASGNSIGGTMLVGKATQDVGNVISGNTNDGVFLDSTTGTATSGNIVAGNFIGTLSTGDGTLANGHDGVFLGAGAVGNTVGGTDLPSSSGGSSGAGNVISNNQIGVEIDWTAGSGTPNQNAVFNNFIGTDVSGTAALGNTIGVQFDGSDGTIDSTSAAGNAMNLIAADGTAVELYAGDASDSVTGLTDDIVTGLHIGSDLFDNPLASDLRNGTGLRVLSGGNTIGTAGTGNGNIIYNNTGNGLVIGLSDSISQTGPGSGNVVQNNVIGLDPNGNAENGNGGNGIVLAGGSSNEIGGTTGLGNVISANKLNGIDIQLAASNNSVQGNTIGSDVTGTLSKDSNGAALGNSEIGIYLEGGTTGTLIGAPLAGQDNLIADSGMDGVRIGTETGAGSSDNSVQGNLIGIGSTGGNLGNKDDGINLVNGSTVNNVIGTDPADILSFEQGKTNSIPTGAGNTIAFNGHNGVTVGSSIKDTAAVGNSILGNSIFGNLGLGIDLGNNGVTLNQNPPTTGDGPNNLQNFPVFTEALLDAKNTVLLKGTLTAFPSTAGDYVEIFANGAADPTGFGEGQTLVAAVFIPGGNGSFQITIPAPITGIVFTATATNLATGDTSEFSLGFIATFTGGNAAAASAVAAVATEIIPLINDLIVVPAKGSITIYQTAQTQDINFNIINQLRQPLVELPGEIHGVVYDDPRAVGQITADMVPLQGQIVFLDTNGNGILDPGERWTVTNEKGEFSFTGLPPGQYRVVPLLTSLADVTFISTPNNIVELRAGAMSADNVTMAIRYRTRRKPGSENRAEMQRPPDDYPLLIIRQAQPAGTEAPANPQPELLPPPTEQKEPTVPPQSRADEPPTDPAWWHRLWAAAVVGPWHYLRERSKPARRWFGPRRQRPEENNGEPDA